MATLTDRFVSLLDEAENDPSKLDEAARLVLASALTPETKGLLALIHHDGIGVEQDLDKSFEFAEDAARDGDPLGYYMLGYMCDNIETPDQKEGGPRQKYDHYDAERFYDKCASKESRWKIPAALWLGDYYMNMARGGDPEVAVDYYESVADDSAEASAALSDYYWELVMPDGLDDEEQTDAVFKWTHKAYTHDPETYSYRLGWLYADGIGCEKSREKAMEYFTEAYSYGDWRGAKSLASMYEERLAENPGMAAAEREHCEQERRNWDEIGDAMHAEADARHDEEEPDDPIEED